VTDCLINEQTAWELVRLVPPGLAGQAHIRVHHHPRPDAWVQVDRAGAWTASECTQAARDLFDLYFPLQVSPIFAIAQAGQSIDGRIATESGHSHFVTGAADILRLHRVRALVDAVVVGASTVAADNPHLTVRRVTGDNPVRVILDPRGRLESTAHVFTDGQAKTLAMRRETLSHVDDEPEPGLVHLPVDETGAAFDPHTILSALHERGLRRVLVEGGGRTVSRFLQTGALDRLHVTVAPLLIGSGRPAFSLDPVASLHDALRPPCRHFRLGDDILFDFDLSSEAREDHRARKR